MRALAGLTVHAQSPSGFPPTLPMTQDPHFSPSCPSGAEIFLQLLLGVLQSKNLKTDFLHQNLLGEWSRTHLIWRLDCCSLGVMGMPDVPMGWVLACKRTDKSLNPLIGLTLKCEYLQLPIGEAIMDSNPVSYFLSKTLSSIFKYLNNKWRIRDKLIHYLMRSVTQQMGWGCRYSRDV